MEQIKTKTVISDTIDIGWFRPRVGIKMSKFYQLTKTLQPYLLLFIFVNTKTRADDLHAYLVAQGLKGEDSRRYPTT